MTETLKHFSKQEVDQFNLEKEKDGLESFIENNSVIFEEHERESKAGNKIAAETEVNIDPTSKVEKKKRFNIIGIFPQSSIIAPGGEREFIEPLGLQYVLTQAANKGYSVELFTLFEQSEKELVENVINKKPEVVAISAMTAQMKIGLSIANRIKEKSPQTKIVFGGYHPSVVHTTTPELISDTSVDYWVRGEGEKTFSELIQTLEQGGNTEEVKGLVYRTSDGRVVKTPRRVRTRDLDSFGRVWRPNFIKYLKNYGLTYPAPSDQKGFASIDYSRGCLGGCDFCASPEVMGRAVSFRSPESVVEEIASLYDEKGINTFFFTDLDFIQRGKNQEKTLALCENLKRINRPIYWECLGRISSISETNNYNLLFEMYQAGCRKIAWGLESIDPEVLDSMKKGKRFEDETMTILGEAERVGILNTAFYIIAWYNFEKSIGDNRAKILRDAHVLPCYPIHRLRITIGTPLPGSQFYRTCSEKGLLTDYDLGHYDTEHLVYRHPSLRKEEIDGLRTEIYKHFYNSSLYKKRVKQMVDRYPEYKKTFNEFLGELSI